VTRCPTCGATSESGDRFCEADGTELVPELAAAAGPACTLCGQGVVEPDGFCSACGRRAISTRPPGLPVGSALAGGTVISSRAPDEHVVRLPDDRTVLVALGEAQAHEREAEALSRLGSLGPFPAVIARGVDDKLGAYLALTLPDATPGVIKAEPANERHYGCIAPS